MFLYCAKEICSILEAQFCQSYGISCSEGTSSHDFLKDIVLSGSAVSKTMFQRIEVSEYGRKGYLIN